MEISSLSSPLKYVLLFVLLVLVQALICNNVLLFGVAIPFVFIYFVLVLPINTNTNMLLSLAFLIGFLVDLFSDTLGLNSLACLLLAVLKKPVFYSYVPREDKYISIVPCISSLGWWVYLKYTLSLSAIFCFLVFGIELLSFASIGSIALMAVSSTVLTVLLLMAIDALFSKDK